MLEIPLDSILIICHYIAERWGVFFNCGYLMLNSAELDGDLLYLQEKYEISSTITDGLTKSPSSAQIHMQHYKTRMLGICLLFNFIGGAFIIIALFHHDQWIGLLSGMVGSGIVVYAISIFKKMKSAIFAIQKIAHYHELL